LIHCHTIFVTGMCQFDQSLHVFFYYTWWPTCSRLQTASQYSFANS
jgi:hypothetical protein